MKICVISNLYKPYQRGGAEIVARLMVKGFEKAGKEVLVISTHPERKSKVEQNQNTKIYRFRPMNLFYYLDDYKHNFFVRAIWHIFDTFNFHSAGIVRKILKKEKPDLIVTHNLKGIGLLIPRVIKKLKIKHIHVLHDVQLAVPSGLIFREKENAFLVTGFPSRIYAWICKRLFKSPRFVVSPSEWLMRFYEKKGFFQKSKREVFPNPIVSSGQAVDKEPERQNRFLFVGQLEKHKGIEWLAELWEKNHIQSELLIIGDGTAKLKCQMSKVKVLGRLEGEELNKIFVQADFLIMPSLCYENSPTVISLAYQNATPVIVANIGGAAELVEKNKTGYIFNAGEEESLLKAINQAQSISDTELEKMSENCTEKVKEFGLAKYIDKVLSLE